MSQQKQFKHVNIVLAVIFILLSVGVLYNGQQAYVFYLETVGRVNPVTDAGIRDAIIIAVTESLMLLAYLPAAILLFCTKKSHLYIIPAAIFVLRYLHTLSVQIYSVISIFDLMSHHKGVMLNQVRGLISGIALTLVAVTVLIYVIRNAKGKNDRVMQLVLATVAAIAVGMILVCLGIAKECSEEFGVRYSQNIYLLHLNLVLKLLAMLLFAFSARWIKKSAENVTSDEETVANIVN